MAEKRRWCNNNKKYGFFASRTSRKGKCKINKSFAIDLFWLVKNWLPKLLKMNWNGIMKMQWLTQSHYRLLVLHASLSNKWPDCIQPIGCSNNLTVGSAAHLEFHFVLSADSYIQNERGKSRKQKETNAMPLLGRSSSENGKLMIGRIGLRWNTKAKIAIFTFRKLKWMHWVDFNLPHQNPHFFIPNECRLTEASAQLG